MPRPTTSPTDKGFTFPMNLGITKIVPNYTNDTATITFTAKGQVRTRTISFTWDQLADFQARAETLIKSLQ